MKLAIAIILAVLMLGCVRQDDTAEFSIRTTMDPIEGGQPSDQFIRLTSRGFEQGEASLKAGESITIYIADDNTDGHYLVLDGERIAEKQLEKGEQVNIPFEKAGTYVLADETSGYELEIEVK